METENGMDSGGISKDDKTMGMLCHLLALVGFIGIPFGNIIGPLVIWLIKREDSEFVNEQGKEALNFQITMTILAIISAILILVVIGIVLAPLVVLADLIFIIVATVATSKGQNYRYPFAFRLIK